MKKNLSSIVYCTHFGLFFMGGGGGGHMEQPGRQAAGQMKIMVKMKIHARELQYCY